MQTAKNKKSFRDFEKKSLSFGLVCSVVGMWLWDQNRPSFVYMFGVSHVYKRLYLFLFC